MFYPCALERVRARIKKVGYLIPQCKKASTEPHKGTFSSDERENPKSSVDGKIGTG